MKKTTETIHQSQGVGPLADFIRENSLVREIENRLVITTKGEEFLHALQESSRQAIWASPGGF